MLETEWPGNPDITRCKTGILFKTYRAGSDWLLNISLDCVYDLSSFKD